MTLDLLAIGLGVLFALLGWRSGAIAQCGRVAAAVAAFFGASPLTRLIQRTVAPETTVSGPLVEGVLLVASGAVIYIAISVGAWLLVRFLWAASGGLSIFDRMGGLALGIVKSLVVVYFLVSAVSLMRGPLRRVDGEDALHVRESRLLAFVDRHNVLLPWRFGDLDRLHDAIKVDRLVERRGRTDLLRRRPEVREVIRSRAMGRITRRAELVEAAVHDRYYETLADSTVRKYLNDRRFVGRLRVPNWERILSKLRGSGTKERSAGLVTPRRSSRISVSSSRRPGCTSVRR